MNMHTRIAGIRALSLALICLFLISLRAGGADKFLTFEGAKLHYVSAGSTGKTVIFVHGWSCSSRSWQFQVGPLAKSHRLLIIDLPGHGESGMPPAKTITTDLFAQAVESLRAAAGGDKAVLVGHSMGALVARRYADLYPEHTAGLVFVDLVVDLPKHFPSPELIGGPDALNYREKIVAGTVGPETPEPIRQEIRRMMLATPTDAAVAAMRASMDPKSWENKPSTVPVLGVYQGKTDACEGEHLKFAESVYPKIECVKFPQTAHFVMMETPLYFNAVLTAFLSRIDY